MAEVVKQYHPENRRIFAAKLSPAQNSIYGQETNKYLFEGYRKPVLFSL